MRLKIKTLAVAATFAALLLPQSAALATHAAPLSLTQQLSYTKSPNNYINREARASRISSKTKGKTTPSKTTPSKTTTTLVTLDTTVDVQLPPSPSTPTPAPALDCTGSGEVSGVTPGWSTPSARQLTTTLISDSTYAAYWCPAAAPSGQGQISYTLTSSENAATCETTTTYCEITSSPTATYSLMATDETGSDSDSSNLVHTTDVGTYTTGAIAFQNDGAIVSCAPSPGHCVNTYQYLLFPTYGNTSDQNDCTLATIADIKSITLGQTPTPLEVAKLWTQADPTNSGITDDQAFSLWKTSGLGGFYLRDTRSLSLDPLTLMRTLDDPSSKALVAQFAFSQGQNIAGVNLASGGYHWAVVDGYTPTGPLIVTWGQTMQMTWQQWNLEITALWLPETTLTPPPTNGMGPTIIPPAALPATFIPLTPTMAKKAVTAAKKVLSGTFRDTSRLYNSLDFVGSLWGIGPTQYYATDWIYHLLPFNALVQDGSAPHPGSVIYYPDKSDPNSYQAAMYLGSQKAIVVDPNSFKVHTVSLASLHPLGWSDYLSK